MSWKCRHLCLKILRLNIDLRLDASFRCASFWGVTTKIELSIMVGGSKESDKKVHIFDALKAKSFIVARLEPSMQLKH